MNDKARPKTLKPPRKISQVAAELGLDSDTIWPHGHYIAKIPIQELIKRQDEPDGHLVLVSAMSPTPQGEGKTTTTIGLGDALRQLGNRTSICLREPSLGPYFGIKGGGTGAGASQVVPAEDINLPAGVETCRIKLTCVAAPGFFTAATPGCRPGYIESGEETRTADSPAGAGLPNLGPGLLQVEISCHGAFNKPGKLRVVECGPPVGQHSGIRVPGGKTSLQRTIPGRRKRRLGR